MPECPSGFMWLARPCCEIDAGCVSSFAEQTDVEVCDPVLADVAESLPVLECDVFVELCELLCSFAERLWSSRGAVCSFVRFL